MKYLQDLEKEVKQLKHELLKICWYMRGGVTYSEAHAMAPTERSIVADIIKDNLDTAKKTGRDFF